VGRQPREVGAQCEIVFTSLPGPREVEAVAADLIANMKTGLDLFDCRPIRRR